MKTLIDGTGNEIDFDGFNIPELVDGELDALWELMKVEELNCHSLEALLDGFDNPRQEMIFLRRLKLIEPTLVTWIHGKEARSDKYKLTRLGFHILATRR